jgi:hypothetical protein
LPRSRERIPRREEIERSIDMPRKTGVFQWTLGEVAERARAAVIYVNPRHRLGKYRAPQRDHGPFLAAAVARATASSIWRRASAASPQWWILAHFPGSRSL